MAQQNQHHGCTRKGNRVAWMQLLLLLVPNQYDAKHFGVHGQITDPSTVQIGDMVWYVSLFFIYQ